MPIVLTAADDADCVTWDVLLVLLNQRKTLRLAGPEHGRAIPLGDIAILEVPDDLSAGKTV